MPVEIPDLWSDDIKPDVLAPLVILKAQDEGISRRTNGIIRSEVVTSKSGKGDVAVYQHSLDLFAPAAGYREQLLTVQHSAKRLYPATITVPDPIDWQERPPPKAIETFAADQLFGGKRKSQSILADSTEKLVNYLKVALRSSQARGLIESLLAQSNQPKSATTQEKAEQD